MENLIILALVAGIVVFALMRFRKHFRGGGCCGSGGNTIRDKKSLSEPKIGEKILSVQGMTCENCEIRVENALNRVDGAAAKVSWKKKCAVVSYNREISNDVLKTAVEKLGYQVTEIR